jgi:hypothetical protein
MGHVIQKEAEYMERRMISPLTLLFMLDSVFFVPILLVLYLAMSIVIISNPYTRE